MTSGGGKGPAEEVLILSGTLVLTLSGPAAGKQRSAVLEALETEERILVSLIDGRRTIRDLTQLSGLPAATARDRLRSLFERGLLIPAGAASPPAPATQAPEEPRRITRDRGSGPTHAGPRITLGVGGAVRAEAPPPVEPIDPPHPQPPAAARAWEAAPPPAAEPEPAAPAGRAGQPFHVGAYDVATRIGQGGMGSIYVCRRAGAAGFQRLFALKVIRQHSGQEETAVRSFLHEGHIGALLAHPNIQSVVDMGSYKDQPFLVLDYVEGASLADLLVDGRRPPATVTVTVLLDVLRGLQAAHDTIDADGRALGLVHGDVSPPNILVGVDGTARLGDFGSARFTARGRPAPAERLVAGRPAYMAPEQLSGESIDARADIFSLGVVMWNALTGEELFTAATHELTVHNTLTKRVPPPSAFGAPACLDDICLRALRRPREERYFTAEEMSSALLKVAAAAELVASPRRVGQLVREQSGEALAERRRRTQAAFAGVSRRATPAPEAAPEAAPAPAHTLALSLSDSMRSTLVVAAAPTAVQARATAASRSRSSSRYLYLSIALGVVAGALTIAVVRSMSAGAGPGAAPVRASSPAEAPPSTPPPGPAASRP